MILPQVAPSPFLGERLAAIRKLADNVCAIILLSPGNRHSCIPYGRGHDLCEYHHVYLFPKSVGFIYRPCPHSKSPYFLQPLVFVFVFVAVTVAVFVSTAALPFSVRRLLILSLPNTRPRTAEPDPLGCEGRLNRTGPARPGD